jgi:hypothetical protein
MKVQIFVYISTFNVHSYHKNALYTGGHENEEEEKKIVRKRVRGGE